MHLGSLRDGFVFDDHLAIEQNPFVQGAAPWRDLWLRDWFGYHRHEALGVGTWRPLVTLSFRLNTLLARGAPWGFHLVNVALHALVTFALGWIFLRVTEKPRWAGLYALLFGVHTLHTEAVVSIVGRAELMMTLFAIGAAVAHASLRRLASLAVVACLLSACLCKESALLIVPVLWLCDLALRPTAWRQLWPRYAAMGLSLLALTTARRAALGSLQGYRIVSAINPLVDAPLALQKFTAVRLLGHAVTLLLLPLNLLPDYGARVLQPAWTADAALALGLATALGGVAAVVRALRARASGAPSQHPWVAAAAVFGVFAAFASNLVLVLPALFAERFWYLPSAAFLFVLVERASGLAGAHARRAACVGMLLWSVLLGALTMQRTAEWRSDETLNGACVQVNPRCGLCVLNLGLERLRADRLREAYGLCRAATDLRPDLGAGFGCVGTVHARLGRIDDAIRLFEQMAPRSAPIEFEGNYARALLLQHRPAEALRQLQRTARGGQWDARTEALRREAIEMLRTPSAPPR